MDGRLRSLVAPRECPVCLERLERCDDGLDPASLGAREREAWLSGEFGWFQCNACGEVTELGPVPPPRAGLVTREVLARLPTP